MSLRFKFIGSESKLRLTYDREIWFPFQQVKIMSKLSNNPKSHIPSKLHKDVSEKFEDYKFKFGENMKQRKNEEVLFRTYKLKLIELFHLKNLSICLNEECIDIHKRKFKLPFDREYIFSILFESKKNEIYLKSRRESPASITALILPEDFEELEFEYV